jgi:hypothetical protein
VQTTNYTSDRVPSSTTPYSPCFMGTLGLFFEPIGRPRRRLVGLSFSPGLLPGVLGDDSTSSAGIDRSGVPGLLSACFFLFFEPRGLPRRRLVCLSASPGLLGTGSGVLSESISAPTEGSAKAGLILTGFGLFLDPGGRPRRRVAGIGVSGSLIGVPER